MEDASSDIVIENDFGGQDENLSNSGLEARPERGLPEERAERVG